MPFRATARDLLKGRYDPEANTPTNVLSVCGGRRPGSKCYSMSSRVSVIEVPASIVGVAKCRRLPSHRNWRPEGWASRGMVPSLFFITTPRYVTMTSFASTEFTVISNSAHPIPSVFGLSFWPARAWTWKVAGSGCAGVQPVHPRISAVK